MDNQGKKTAALLIALVAAVIGAWERIDYELKSLPSWKRYLIDLAAVLFFTLVAAWIMRESIAKLLTKAYIWAI